MVDDLGIAIPGGFYRDSDHSYFDEAGTRIPSVTQVFSLLGFQDFSNVPQATLEHKQQFGIALHSGVEYLTQKDLDWDTVSDEVLPALVGVEQRLKAMRYVHEAGEEQRIINIFGMKVGGTLDLRGRCQHQGKERNVLIDLKTADKPSACWKWQLGAYAMGQEKVAGGWLALVLQVDYEGNVKPHYVDLLPAQRQFQCLLSTVILGLNEGLYRLGK